MTSNNFCNLIFNTSLEKRRTVRIPDPIMTLSTSTIQTAASGIISANPFDETVGSLLSLANAELVTVNRIVLIQNN